MKTISILSILSILLIGTSCKKLVNVDPPPNQLSPDKVFDNVSSVNAATANMYTVLNSVESNFNAPVGTYTDELITTNTDATSAEFSSGVLTSADTKVLSVWQNLYSTIYKANGVIEGLQTATFAVPDSVQSQCLGEALFLRAYAHLTLCNIYGDVPIVTSTNVDQNALIARSPVSVVYAQVIADLQQASARLTARYPGSGEKVRANKWAAVALLAKVYLYDGDAADAETQATLLINSGQYTLLGNLNNVFLANSTEAILQLWNANGFTTLNAVPASGIPAYQVSTNLMNAFEANDQRKVNWVKSTLVSGTNYYYPYKYKQRTTTTGNNAEYSMYIRLAEVYLIRAEARVRLNKLMDAATDLNLIRNRAGLPNTLATTQGDLLTAIFHERQVELFQEGGNRLFDLRRSGTMDVVIGAIKPLWVSSGDLFPIPKSERLSDPNLSQNSGYSN